MGELRIRRCGLKVIGTVALLATGPLVTPAQSITASGLNEHSVPVYVEDFELSAVGSKVVPPARSQTSAVPMKRLDANPAAVGGSPAGPSSMFLDSDAPSAQARQLMDFFSVTLIQMLQKDSYAARRQRGARPENGVMIRGVFGDVDPMNHVRKAILGSASSSTKYTLYVAVFNLARPDQPLYQLAVVQSPDSRLGPVITLSNYIPMARYELDKNPAEDDIRKICAHIVRSLTELLRANPTAFSK